MVEPGRGVRVVDGILTGWHDPDASHLLMLEAIGGRELVERSYAAALATATSGTSSAIRTCCWHTEVWLAHRRGGRPRLTRGRRV